MTRQTLANRNLVVARGVTAMALAACLVILGAACAGSTSATTNVVADGSGNLLNRGTLPATGILIDKIKADPAVPGSVCGSPMPLGGAMLAQEDLDCLQAWANGLVNSVGP